MNKGYNVHLLQALFKDYLVAEKISRLSIKSYLSDVRHYLSWMSYRLSAASSDNLYQEDQGIGLLDKLIIFSNERVICDYIAYMEANSIPVSSINRRISALRKFYSFCVKRGVLKLNPTHNIRNISVSRDIRMDKTEINELHIMDDLKKYLQDNLNNEDVQEYMEEFEKLIMRND